MLGSRSAEDAGRRLAKAEMLEPKLEVIAHLMKIKQIKVIK